MKSGQLTVRGVDLALIKELKLRAAANGRSAEAEVREILRAALAPEVDLKAVLLAGADVDDPGDDALFERNRGPGRPIPDLT